MTHRLLALLAIVGLTLLGCSEDKTQAAAEHAFKAQQLWNQGKALPAAKEIIEALQADPNNAHARLLSGTIYVALGLGVPAEIEFRNALRRGVRAERVQHLLARSLLLQNDFAGVLAVREFRRMRVRERASLSSSKGYAYMGVGDSKSADTSFDNALKLHPKNARAMLGKARLAALHNDFDTAKIWTERAFKVIPNYGPAWELIGDIRYHQRDYEGAEEALTQSLQYRMDDFGSYLKRGLIRLELKKYKEARQDVAALGRWTRRHPDSNYLKGLLAFANNNMERTINVLGLVLNDNPRHLKARFYLGTALYRQGEPNRARELLTQFLARSPKHVGARKVLALTEMRLRRYDRAERILGPLLAENPDDPFVLNNLSIVFLKQGKTASAVQMLKRLVKIRPKVADSYINLGAGLLLDGRAKSAREITERAVQLDPKSLEARRMLVKLLTGEKKYNDAVSVAKAGKVMDPRNPAFDIMVGNVYLKAKQYVKARQAFKTADELDPGNVSAGQLLGLLSQREKDYDSSRRHFRKVLRHHPKHVLTTLRLAALEELIGNSKQAIALLEQILSDHPKALFVRLTLARMQLVEKADLKALALLSEVRGDYSDRLDWQLVYGEALLAKKDYSSARVALENLVNKYPKSAKGHFLLALAYDKFHQYEKMEKSLDQALKLAPNHPGARVARIRLLLAKRKTAAARKEIADLIKRSGSTPELSLLRGLAATQAKDSSTAEQAYREAFERGARTRYLLALVGHLWRTDKRDLALKTLSDWISRNPDDLGALLTLAQSSMELDRENEAIQAFLKIVKLERNNPRILNNLAWFMNHRDNRKALQYARRAHALAPESVDVLDTYALVLKEAGDLERAQRMIKKARMLNKTASPMLMFHDAQIKAAAGDKNGAMGILRTLLSSDHPFSKRGDAEALLRKLGTS